MRMIKSRKGLSNAVVALILIIATMIIALVTVGYVFGLFGALAGMPIVKVVGTPYMIGDAPLYTGWVGWVGHLWEPRFPNTTQDYVVVLTLQSTGRVDIVGASITGTPLSVNSSEIMNAHLKPGNNTVVIVFPANNYQLSNDSTYTIMITLSDGQTILSATEYEGAKLPKMSLYYMQIHIRINHFNYYYRNPPYRYYSIIPIVNYEHSSKIIGGGILGTSLIGDIIPPTNIIYGYGAATFVNIFFKGQDNLKPYQQYTVVLILDNEEVLLVNATYLPY